MKYSQFNTFQPFEDKILAYNAFTDKYLLLEHMLYDMIQSAKASNNIMEIDEVHPAFYAALLDYGFIVEKDTDEIEKVRQLMQSVDNNDEFYRLIINPTMNCNFKCWYCYETHIKESKMDDETIDKTALFINNTLKNSPKIKNFFMSFFGGEPLLYYKKTVLPLLEKGNEIARKYGVGFSSDFTTNGFLITPEMIPEMQRLNVTAFQITFDGNREKHNMVRFVSQSRGSYDDIMKNIFLLADNNFKVTVRVNYTEDNLDGLEEILDDLSGLGDESRKNVNVTLQKVWQEKNENLGEKVNSFMNLVKILGFATSHGILADNVRYSCYADKKNHATINYNGEVHKCTARDFSSDNKEGILTENGEIEWNQKYETRITAKLKNKPCLECAILPICGGGCSQKAMENLGKDYCVNFFDEDRKKSIVMSRFLSVAEDYMVTEE
jgi:uncharacterized protein